MIKLILPNSSKAISLMELLIAIFLIGVIIIAVSNLLGTVYSMKKNILDKQGPLIQGALASAIIFDRLSRAAANANSTLAFNITDSGRRIDYVRPGLISGQLVNESIWLDTALGAGNYTVRYFNGDVERVILTKVKNLQFVQDFNNRVSAEIIIEYNNQTFKTAVQPRNEFTVKSKVN